MATLQQVQLSFASRNDVPDGLAAEVIAPVLPPPASIARASSWPASPVLIIASNAASAAAQSLLPSYTPVGSISLGPRLSVSLVAQDRVLLASFPSVEDEATWQWVADVIDAAQPCAVIAADTRAKPAAVYDFPEDAALFRLGSVSSVSTSASTGGGTGAGAGSGAGGKGKGAEAKDWDAIPLLPAPLLLSGCTAAALSHAAALGIPCGAVRCYASPRAAAGVEAGLAVGAALAAGVAAAASSSKLVSPASDRAAFLVAYKASARRIAPTASAGMGSMYS